MTITPQEAEHRRGYIPGSDRQKLETAIDGLIVKQFDGYKANVNVVGIEQVVGFDIQPTHIEWIRKTYGAAGWRVCLKSDPREGYWFEFDRVASANDNK